MVYWKDDIQHGRGRFINEEGKLRLRNSRLAQELDFHRPIPAFGTIRKSYQ